MFKIRATPCPICIKPKVLASSPSPPHACAAGRPANRRAAAVECEKMLDKFFVEEY